MREQNWNSKVSTNRSPEWKKKLAAGRLDAQMNPTKVKIERVRLGISQVIAAKKLKLSKSTYGSIERGLRVVDENRAKAFAKLLNKPLKNLFDTKDKNKYLAVK